LTLPTIKEIAKLAGVSTATVSRVINNYPHISKKTRLRVQEVIQKFGYTPNAVARSLVTRKTATIGLVLSDITNPFYAEIARGIEDEARKYNYNVIFCSTDNTPEIQKTYIDLLYEKRVDGLIFASARIHDPDIEKLALEGIPFVLVNRKLEGIKTNYVVVDNFLGAYVVAEHLIKLGHQRIGFIRGPLDYSTGIDRLEGYKKALLTYNIEFNGRLIKQGDFKRKSGYLACKEFLRMRNRPTAIFGSNDFMALGAWEAILEASLRVPEDIALVGFDDIELTSLKGIELTTVSQEKYRMGIKAVKILVDNIKHKEKKMTHQIILKPKLIIRKSCGYNYKKSLETKS